MNSRLRLNLLVSYVFARGEEKLLRFIVEAAPYANLLIDCGAFTNFSNRRKRAVGGKISYADVTLEQYIAACKQYFHGRVWQYIALDVIRQPEGTERNLQAMLDAGLLPMPVYIEGWPVAKLREITAINKRICVPGGVMSNDHYIRKRFIKAYEDSGKVAKMHGLGFGRFPDVFQLPLASGDSSAFMAGGRYGSVLQYNRNTGFSSITWRELGPQGDKLAEKRARFIRWLVEDCKTPPDFLKKPEAYTGIAGIPSFTYVFGYLQFAQHCTERGFDFFLALSSRQWVSMILTLVENATPNGFDLMRCRERVVELRTLSNIDGNRWVDECVRILKEKTDWTPLPHSA